MLSKREKKFFDRVYNKPNEKERMEKVLLKPVLDRQSCSINIHGINITSVEQPNLQIIFCVTCKIMICKGCLEECHVSHDFKEKDISDVSSFTCECGKNNHIVETRKKDVEEYDERVCCQMSSFLSEINFDKMYLVNQLSNSVGLNDESQTQSNQHYCLYCFNFCVYSNMEDEEEEENPNEKKKKSKHKGQFIIDVDQADSLLFKNLKVSKKKTYKLVDRRQNNLVCNCTKIENHKHKDGKDNNIKLLESIFEYGEEATKKVFLNKSRNQYFNNIFLAIELITPSSYLYKTLSSPFFFEKIFEIKKRINFSNLEDKSYFQAFNETQLTKDVKEMDSNFKKMFKILQRASKYWECFDQNFLAINDTLKACFNFPELQCFFKIDEDKNIDDIIPLDNAINFKYILLFFYRKLFLKNKINVNKKIFDIDDSNISSLHRSWIQIDFTDNSLLGINSSPTFFSNVEESQGMFISFLENLPNTIILLIEKVKGMQTFRKSSQVSLTDTLKMLVLEYLKYSKIVLSYKMNDYKVFKQVVINALQILVCVLNYIPSILQDENITFIYEQFVLAGLNRVQDISFNFQVYQDSVDNYDLHDENNNKLVVFPFENSELTNLLIRMFLIVNDQDDDPNFVPEIEDKKNDKHKRLLSNLMSTRDTFNFTIKDKILGIIFQKDDLGNSYMSNLEVFSMPLYDYRFYCDEKFEFYLKKYDIEKSTINHYIFQTLIVRRDFDEKISIRKILEKYHSMLDEQYTKFEKIFASFSQSSSQTGSKKSSKTKLTNDKDMLSFRVYLFRSKYLYSKIKEFSLIKKLILFSRKEEIAKDVLLEFKNCFLLFTQLVYLLVKDNPIIGEIFFSCSNIQVFWNQFESESIKIGAEYIKISCDFYCKLIDMLQDNRFTINFLEFNKIINYNCEIYLDNYKRNHMEIITTFLHFMRKGYDVSMDRIKPIIMDNIVPFICGFIHSNFTDFLYTLLGNFKTKIGFGEKDIQDAQFFTEFLNFLNQLDDDVGISILSVLRTIEHKEKEKSRCFSLDTIQEVSKSDIFNSLRVPYITLFFKMHIEYPFQVSNKFSFEKNFEHCPLPNVGYYPIQGKILNEEGDDKNVTAMLKEAQSIGGQRNLENFKRTFDVLIGEMKKYPFYFKEIEYQNLHKSKFKSLLSQFHYFKYSIINPSIKSIYLITYFLNFNEIKLDQKYIIYQIMVLFIRCFNFFIENIGEIDSEKVKFFQKYFNFPEYLYNNIQEKMVDDRFIDLQDRPINKEEQNNNNLTSPKKNNAENIEFEHLKSQKSNKSEEKHDSIYNEFHFFLNTLRGKLNNVLSGLSQLTKKKHTVNKTEAGSFKNILGLDKVLIKEEQNNSKPEIIKEPLEALKVSLLEKKPKANEQEKNLSDDKKKKMNIVKKIHKQSSPNMDDEEDFFSKNKNIFENILEVFNKTFLHFYNFSGVNEKERDVSMHIQKQTIKAKIQKLKKGKEVEWIIINNKKINIYDGVNDSLDKFMEFFNERRKKEDLFFINSFFENDEYESEIKKIMRIKLKRTLFKILITSVDFDLKQQTEKTKKQKKLLGVDIGIVNESKFACEKNLIILKRINTLFITDPRFCQDLLSEIYDEDKIKRLFLDVVKFYQYYTQFFFINLNCILPHDTYIIKSISILSEFLRLCCENHNDYYQNIVCDDSIQGYKIPLFLIEYIRRYENFIESKKGYVFYFGEIKTKYLDFQNNILSISGIKTSSYLTEVVKEQKMWYKKVVGGLADNISKENPQLIEDKNKIKELQNKACVIFEHYKYYNSILEKQYQLLEEIFQGNTKHNNAKLIEFIKNRSNNISLGNYCFFETYANQISNLNSKEKKKLFNYFIKFVILILDFKEKGKKETNKDDDDRTLNEITNLIKKKIDLKQLLNVMRDCYQSLLETYVIKKGNTISEENYESYEESARKLIKSFILSTHSSFKKTSKHDKKNKMLEDINFNLLVNSGMLLFILAKNFNQENAVIMIKTLKEAKKKSKETINRKLRTQLVAKAELYSFLNKVIKSVEISVEYEKHGTSYDNSNDGMIKLERKLQREYFIIFNDSLLIEYDIEKIKEDADSDYSDRLTYIFSQIDKLIQVQNFRKWVYEENNLWLNIHSKLNYRNIQIYSCLVVVFVNISLQWNLDIYDTRRIEWPYWVNLAHCIVLLYFIFFYCVFYYWKENSFSIQEKKKSLWMKSYDLLKSMVDLEILPLTWNLAIGILAIIFPKWWWLYAIQLFSVFNLFLYMRIAVYSVYLRAESFVAVLALIIILIFFFNAVAFYFLRELYDFEDNGENLCHSYIHCFFSHLNLGLRQGGGIGDLDKYNEYNSVWKSENYWATFIFGYIFFFIMILLMLNIINGIIVDTFQNIREDENKKLDVKKNNCLMCNLERDEFNKKLINFDQHQVEDHCFQNYIYYLIKISMLGENNLNKVEYEVLKQMKANNVSFFPIKESMQLKEKSS